MVSSLQAMDPVLYWIIVAPASLAIANLGSENGVWILLPLNDPSFLKRLSSSSLSAGGNLVVRYLLKNALDFIWLWLANPDPLGDHHSDLIAELVDAPSDLNDDCLGPGLDL